MSFLLDTNAVIAVQKFNPLMLARLKRHRATEIYLSAIVAHELYFGAYRSRRVSQNLDDLERLQFAQLDFDLEDARRAGEVRAILARHGQSVGPYDVLIAGQALARRLTLVTHNVREFERVEGLAVEDWEAAT